MTSKEALQKIDLTIKYGSMTQDEINSYLEYKKIIEKDLEVLDVFRRHIKHIPNFYINQAQYGYEEYRFNLVEDSVFVDEDKKEQRKKDFSIVKRWYENE